NWWFSEGRWVGRMCEIKEDLTVHLMSTEKHRILDSLYAIRSQCNCMHFLVVIWNQASIDYYTHRGALDLSSEEGWHLFRFNRQELMDMAKEE
uniref:N-acetyltransferase domain-containing protein n=1 Tax=Panthera leo TaxID=9689 RepID=A0A8C8XP35_PANLE